MKRISYYLILIAPLLFSCKNKSGNFKQLPQAADKHDTTSKTIQILTPNSDVYYNFYIENSGSMNGYFSPSAAFKEVLVSFLSDIPTRLNGKTGLYFVNTTTCQQLPDRPTSELVHFVQNLNPQSIKANCPPNGNSLIDDVIRLSTTDIDNNISIVVSDCIFSFNKDKGSSLPVAAADIKMSVAQKLRQHNFGTIVLKYNSVFSGNYYTESDGGKGLSIHDVNRPYYIMIFGREENLRNLLKRIDFSAYKNFEASYCLLPGGKDKKVNAAITYQEKKGAFSFEKPASRMVIHDAEADKENNIFQFSLLADLSSIPAERTYLLDVNNYTVNDGFKIVAVKPVEDTSAGYTHIITVSTDNLQTSHELLLGLKYDIPAWVKNTGNEHDNNPNDSAQQHQTFGFKYLMDGFSQAYQAENSNTQFTIPITISKNHDARGAHGSFPWWIIMVIIIASGSFIWIKNKKR